MGMEKESLGERDPENESRRTRPTLRPFLAIRRRGKLDAGM